MRELIILGTASQVPTRTFCWIDRCRRTVRDSERLPQHHAAMIQWAMIALMTRRLAHHHT